MDDEVTPSSGNVFRDLGLPRPEELEREAEQAMEIAEVIIGPWSPLPPKVKYTLAELRKVRWGQCNRDQQAAAMNAARAIVREYDVRRRGETIYFKVAETPPPVGVRLLVGWRDQFGNPVSYTGTKLADGPWVDGVGGLIGEPDYWAYIPEMPKE